MEDPAQNCRLKKNSLRWKTDDLKQMKLSFPNFPKPTTKQSQLDEDIVHLVADESVKKSIVEAPSFIKLIAHLDSSVKVMSRKMLDKKIDAKLKKSNDETVSMLDRATFVCTTADIWTRKVDSFMGMTAHFIDNDLKRISRALSVRHFESPHSGKV